jgi:hypothetical protein
MLNFLSTIFQKDKIKINNNEILLDKISIFDGINENVFEDFEDFSKKVFL